MDNKILCSSNLSIKQKIENHSILPKKKYSQNFLIDQNICKKIVQYLNIDCRSSVIEIGAGIGNLTQFIINASPRKIIVLELDKSLIKILNSLKKNFINLDVHNCDATKIELQNIIDTIDDVKVISNLPYNVASKIIFKCLSLKFCIPKLVFLLQKELVDRIIARPNSKAYGKLSVICQVLYFVKKSFDVSANSFYPKPKVTSSVVEFSARYKYFDQQTLDNLFLVTKIAFAQRRKIIKQSLNFLFTLSNLEFVLRELGINTNLRAENISPKEYLSISQKIIFNKSCKCNL